MQRVFAIVVYLFAWLLTAYATGPLLRQLLGSQEYSIRTPDSEMTVLESFNRFAVMYWFTSFLLVATPFNLIAWIYLRRRRSPPIRWRWLAACCLWILPSLIIGWLVFRPVLFAP